MSTTKPSKATSAAVSTTKKPDEPNQGASDGQNAGPDAAALAAAAAAEAQERADAEARERDEAATREREHAARIAAEAEADAAARAAARTFPRDMLLVNETAQQWVVRKYIEPASTQVIHVRDEDDLHGLRQNCLNLLSVSDHYRPVAPAEGEDAAPNALRVVEIEDDQA